MTYIQGDIADALDLVERAQRAIHNLTQRSWRETDEYGLENQFYAMPDGTILTQDRSTGEWDQVEQT